ncbi:acyl carrier protein [Streptomyces sp. MUSC 125]|jgi:act minimal PKS acyl carrier protein|uniref:acyl carrier protein n=1 Tax=unclassified Streptomyces TaxID=2593676 RepID=UPI00057E6455|nr:acyl carrier protein [Streptomyces sp. MUSC 125]KIE26507.1 acyl carrier protein [Streptomyces sp. MUSC 125]
MATFTQADLVRCIREAAGEDEGLDLDGDIADMTFADMGYDSVAMVEVTLLVERELGIGLPEDDRTGKEATPKQFVELVNELLPASI